MCPRIFNEDGTFAENGGCTKPAKQDAELTSHQVVTDVKRARCGSRFRFRSSSWTGPPSTSRSCGADDCLPWPSGAVRTTR